MLEEATQHARGSAAPLSFSARRHGSCRSEEVTLCTRDPDASAGEGKIAVRLAASERYRELATRLLNQRYLLRGYGAQHELASGENCATFTVCSDNDIVGTLTLAVDSEAGLAADRAFKQELDLFRSDGRKICELRSFAFDSSRRSRFALATLFHTIFAFESQRFGCTDVFIEVSPRHVRFYETMLCFERVGPAKYDRSVSWWPSEVPVQLMRLHLADMRDLIDQHAGTCGAQGRSLYPCFLANAEERALTSRIAALLGTSLTRSAVGAGW